MRAAKISVLAVLTWGLIAQACGGTNDDIVLAQDTEANILVTSSAFSSGEAIPALYTCDGEEGISPPLSWSAMPTGTRSIALVADDPDAPGGTWVHWVYYGIPPATTQLQESIPTDGVLADGSIQGKNDFNRIGYGGPRPPGGSVHRYFFKVYALDEEVSLGPGATKTELIEAVDGHILGSGELIGTYQSQ